MSDLESECNQARQDAYRCAFVMLQNEGATTPMDQALENAVLRARLGVLEVQVQTLQALVHAIIEHDTSGLSDRMMSTLRDYWREVADRAPMANRLERAMLDGAAR
jgi:hypothetical protein